MRSVSLEFWKNTSIPRLLPCDCFDEALIWYCPSLSWYHCVCPPAVFVLFVCCPVEWKSKLLLSPHSIHLNLKRYLYLQLSVLCKSPSPWWIPSTHWPATGDFSIVLLSYLKIWKLINHGWVPLLKLSVRCVKIGHLQRCGEICICFLGSHFLFLKFKIYNSFSGSI